MTKILRNDRICLECFGQTTKEDVTTFAISKATDLTEYSLQLYELISGPMQEILVNNIYLGFETRYLGRAINVFEVVSDSVFNRSQEIHHVIKEHVLIVLAPCVSCCSFVRRFYVELRLDGVLPKHYFLHHVWVILILFHFDYRLTCR